MAYTSIYDKILRNPYKITWLDLFSDSLKKHSRQDMEYAMIAGTSMDSATESNMLQKWRKPWLFRAILIGGIAISFIIFAIVYACIQLFEISHIAALNLLFVIVPPIVVPFALMVFFWELNVPRNISIYQLLGYFMVGGMLSILATLIVDIVAPQGAASLAPFSEEPGKLIVAALLIKLFGSNKNRKVYGITGLVIGAAVGAGFGGFESAQYAYNMVDWVQVGGFYIWEEAFEAIVMNEALKLGKKKLVLGRHDTAKQGKPYGSSVEMTGKGQIGAPSGILSEKAGGMSQENGKTVRLSRPQYPFQIMLWKPRPGRMVGGIRQIQPVNFNIFSEADALITQAADPHFS